MFGLGAGEIVVILVFALIFIGPKKLPELARGLGKGIREFQRAKDDLMNEVHRDEETEKVAKVEEKSEQETHTLNRPPVAQDTTTENSTQV